MRDRMGQADRAGGVPVHDRDVWLFVIKELLPQALGQEIHTLLLHCPAAREGTAGEVWDLLAFLSHGALVETSRAPVYGH